MGQRGVKILLLLAALWVGWWAIATTGLQRGVTAWMQAPRANGMQITAADMTRAGFPFGLTTLVQGITLTTADGQSSVNVPEATVSAAIYWPGQAKVTVPEGEIAITTRSAAMTLSHKGAQGAVDLRSNTNLTMRALRISMDNPQLDLTEGRLAQAQAVQASLLELTTPLHYQFDFSAVDLTMGSVLRQAMRLPNAWPEMFEHFGAVGEITLDRPLDRHATAGNRPQPTALRIDSARAVWGEIGVAFIADVTVAAGGILTGTATLRAENWQRMLDLAQSAGALTADTRPQIESALTLLAGMSGGGSSLDAQITITDGQMRLGFFPLGPAPRLVIP